MKSFVSNKKTQIISAIALAFATLLFVAIYLITGSNGWGMVAVAAGVGLLLAAALTSIRAMNIALHLNKKAADLQREVAAQADSVEATSRRVKQIYPVVHNTAGSVGRMAPIVRDIRDRVASQPKVQAAAPAKAVPAQTVPAKKKEISLEAKFPAIQFPQNGQPTFPVTAMVIADDFTAAAYSYEWKQITPTRSNWKQELDNNHVDLLFVESAWEGNGGDWRYQLVGQSAPRPDIIELVKECQNRDIPTVFWNKEDPPHFEDFLDTAKLFDYIFTTDVNKIPEYLDRLPHKNVDVLPFAAQPKIHNPAKPRGVEREGEVCFGGMYFRDKYPERRAQMDYLLPAAAKFKLDIFSRQLGGDAKYQFPEPFNKMVRGSLPYPSMLTAYHGFKVVLNVNSVVDSQSMCARRIFEATACGAAVVSAPSPAITHFYPDGLVTVADDEDSAYQKMRILLRSPDFRQRQVHLAQRLTWREYTYTQSVEKILSTIGRPMVKSNPKITVITPTIRPENLENIFQNFGQQTYQDRELVVCCHGFDAPEREIARFAQEFGVEDYQAISRPKEAKLADNLNEMIQISQGEVIARMDDDDWYGPNYLLDLYYALDYSGADVVGKAASYIWFEEPDMTVLTMPTVEHRYTQLVRGATLMARKQTFLDVPFPKGKRGEDTDFLENIRTSGRTIYCADRFNFSVTRKKSKDAHTWSASDDLLFGTGEMKYLGRALKQIEI